MAFALVIVVMAKSLSITLVTKPRNNESRAATFRLSLKPPRLCRILFGNLVQILVVVHIRRRAIVRQRRGRSNQTALSVKLHAETKAQIGQYFFNLIERFPAEVLGAQHLRLGPLDQVANGLNISVFEAVIRTH